MGDLNENTKAASVKLATEIAGLLAAGAALISTCSHPEKPQEPPQNHEEAPPAISDTPKEAEPKIITIRNCRLDEITILKLQQNDLLLITQEKCAKGEAETVGPTFRFPGIHTDPRLQYFNPAQFNEIHGITGSNEINKANYELISEKVSYCFESGYKSGSSPQERIDIEIDCLERQKISPQDLTYLLLAQEAEDEKKKNPS